MMLSKKQLSSCFLNKNHALQSLLLFLSGDTPVKLLCEEQFFVMHEDAFYLDRQYAAFGKVIEGMEVVDEIATTQTDFRDRPVSVQRMKKVTAETFGVAYPEPEKV